MNAKSKVKIHNRFELVSRDAKSGKIKSRAKAENMVLNRMYDRLCNFNAYFTNIVFGRGTGTIEPTRTTLFSRIGNMSANTEELVRAYPVSTWTRHIRLNVNDFNGETLTEIGISDTTTNINTHALISDSEGNPISVEKDEYTIIDIYATVFVTIYDVDSGLYFYGNGLRTYLTGGSAPSNVLQIGKYAWNNDGPRASQTGTRTADVANRKVEVFRQFGVEDFNDDVQFLEWDGAGIRCKVPRPDVFTGTNKEDVEIGVGDGVKTVFRLPHLFADATEIYVDGEPSAYTQDLTDITLSSPAPDGEVVTADMFCTLFPKDEHHVLNVKFVIEFDVSEPSPVVPEPPSQNVPGNTDPIAGTEDHGFFGEVPFGDFISGEDLCGQLGITEGTLINSEIGWLKFSKGHRRLLVSKRAIRHSISWDHINSRGCVFGESVVNIGGKNYAVRLLSSHEWEDYIYPIHEEFGDWAQYTDSDLLIASGNGRATWTSTPSGSSRVCRGIPGVTSSDSLNPSFSLSYIGFRPVLELLD